MTNQTKKTPKLEERRTIYEGRIFKVEVDHVALPNGRAVSMEMVRHPGSVVMLAMPAPDRIILIRQYRYTIGRWIWELPAGSLEHGEDPAAGAARECEEEIGLVPGRVERLRSYYPTPGFCDEMMTYYRCTDLRKPAADSAAHKDEDEDLEPRTFTIDQWRELVRSGEIADLKTAVGLLLV